MSRRDWEDDDFCFRKHAGIVVKLDGEALDRRFRNKGDAISWLIRSEGLTREEIHRRCRFVSAQAND